MYRLLNQHDAAHGSGPLSDAMVNFNMLYIAEADSGRGLGGVTPPDYPADSEIWRKGVADRL